VEFVLTDDVHDFCRQTRELLTSRIECNIHATVLRGISEGRFPNKKPVFAYGLDADDQVRFAALRTPPWPMLATELEPPLAPQFIELWLAADPEVPGINALPGTARAIAAAWAARSGGRASVRLREAMHVLERVREPRRPASGGLRPAEQSERKLLAGWMRAFAQEAGIRGGEEAEQLVDAQLAHGRLFVWDDAGPVSMAGTAPRVSRVTRIGPVYTPPEHRGRGYATNMVAALSHRALADGAARCALYTDLANPTSNKIYAEVGYRRIADWEEHAFELDASP
jgi:GNAT superfamily N-acetyltransferase